MDWHGSGVADSTGALTVTVQPTSYLPWTVSQVSIEMTGTTAVPVPGTTTCVIRKNGFAVSPVVAQLDAAGGDPPIELQPGDQMTVEWSGAAAGNVGKVLVIYDQG